MGAVNERYNIDTFSEFDDKTGKIKMHWHLYSMNLYFIGLFLVQCCISICMDVSIDGYAGR